MSIDKQGWLSWALKVPGPGSKTYAGVLDYEGLAEHSMEGTYLGSLGELMNLLRQASWHFSNCLNGDFFQHYPITAKCWASGNQTANSRYLACESEGRAGALLNSKQVANLLRLKADLDAYSGKPLQRKEPRTLWEHRELAQKWSPNAGPTACPSGRYEPFYAALNKSQEKPVVSQEEFDLMKARMTTMESALTGATTDTVAAMNEHMKKGYRSVLDRINTLETTGSASSGNAITGTFVGTITKAKG